MPHANVSLPRLHIASRREDVELVLQGSLLLTLPDNFTSPATSGELLKLVTEGHLWTRRTGSCHFNVLVSAGGQPITGDDKETRLAEWIQTCEVCSLCRVKLETRLIGADLGAARAPTAVLRFLAGAAICGHDIFYAASRPIVCACRSFCRVYSRLSIIVMFHRHTHEDDASCYQQASPKETEDRGASSRPCRH